MNSAVMERQAAPEQSRDELVKRNEELRKAYGQLEANEEVLRKNYRELQDVETALRQSEQRFIDIISHLPDATFAIDRQHRIIAWNHAMEDMVGIPAATILGRDGSEASISIYSVKRPLLLDLVLDNDGEIRNKYPGLRKEGHRLIADLYVPTLYGGKGAYVWLIASPLYDTEGNVTGAIESIRDVTERRKAEEAVKKSGREWQTTFDAITDPVFLMDDQMRIVRHNHALETFLKKTAEEIDGSPCHEIMHSTGYPVAGCPNVKAHKSRQRESLELKIGDRWFVASVDPVFSDNGTITGCVHLLVDITDRKRAEEALDLARRKLNLLNAITFSDIRNAVFSLSGYLQLDKQSATEDGQPLRYTDKEIRLVSQISDSIKYTEIYQGLGLKSPVWQQVSQSFLLGISHLDISRLSRKLEIGSVEIFADPMLEKVFFALADNVVQHAPAATGYSLSCQETPEGLIIFFEDNGPGVPGSLKENIFEREYGRRKGIGLYLSREILSVTGISIRETGEPGKGARFEILVPKGGYRIDGKP